MKKIVLLAIAAMTLAACADTRSHISKDAHTWEKNEYQVGRDTQKLDEQQQEIGKRGEAERVYKDGMPTFR